MERRTRTDCIWYQWHYWFPKEHGCDRPELYKKTGEYELQRH